MHLSRTLIASAVVAAFAPSAFAQTVPAEPVLPQVIVTASPLGGGESGQILAPTKVLGGDELRDKLGASLGETLSTELGVSASGFGAGASRPIIRGLEGARVKMLENGMTVADVSGLSNDHAVSADGAISRQIEILRGPAALLYGSGAIGGLVNVVNERIPTALEQHPTGQLEMRYGTVDRAGAVSGSADAAVGQVGLHVDGSIRHADDYRIPGARVAGEPDIGRLPHSATRQHSGGAGLSLVGDWGHLGASVSTLSNLYGIPSLEGSRIDQDQRRYDVDGLLKAPAAGIEQVRVKFGYTDYRHAELDDAGAAEVRFANRALESRVEVAHVPLAGWHGSVGLQTENTHFSALNAEGGPDTVPATHSTTRALFAVEEREFGGVRVNAGVRGEQVKRTPVGAPQRSFDLGSASLGAQWPFAQDYTVGATLSLAQRAPATEELYSGGPHDATATFDIGNPDFRKETSRNLELSLQRQRGKLAWKANLFVNKVKDFIYGDILPGMVDEEGAPQAGGPLRLRRFAQADATLHGAEAEVGYNQHQLGWSGRAFADFSRGRLDDLGNLPLQPAARFGADLTYRSSEVRATLSAVRTLRQERLAAFEGAHAPAYTQLNASISHTQHLQGVDLTWFLLGKNLLNEEIRLATSLLKDVAPLPGRSWVFGVRIKF